MVCVIKYKIVLHSVSLVVVTMRNYPADNYEKARLELAFYEDRSDYEGSVKGARTKRPPQRLLDDDTTAPVSKRALKVNHPLEFIPTLPSPPNPDNLPSTAGQDQGLMADMGGQPPFEESDILDLQHDVLGGQELTPLRMVETAISFTQTEPSTEMSDPGNCG